MGKTKPVRPTTVFNDVLEAFLASRGVKLPWRQKKKEEAIEVEMGKWLEEMKADGIAVKATRGPGWCRLEGGEKTMERVREVLAEFR